MQAGNTWQLKKAASISNSPGYVRRTHPSQTCKLPTRFMTVLEMRNAREERNRISVHFIKNRFISEGFSVCSRRQQP